MAKIPKHTPTLAKIRKDTRAQDHRPLASMAKGEYGDDSRPPASLGILIHVSMKPRVATIGDFGMQRHSMALV